MLIKYCYTSHRVQEPRHTRLCLCSNKNKSEVKWKLLSCFWLFVTPWNSLGILQARTLEWVAVPFSKGYYQPTVQTQISCIAGGFLISLATREAQVKSDVIAKFALRPICEVSHNREYL